MGEVQGAMPGKEEGRRDSGGFNEGTPASLLVLDLPRLRGAHGEGGGARNSATAKDRKRSRSNSPSRRPMEEDALLEDL